MGCDQCGQTSMHDDDIVTVPEYVNDRPVDGELIRPGQ